MKLIFLEVVHQALYSGKVWGNRFFSILYTLSRSLQQTVLKAFLNYLVYTTCTLRDQETYPSALPAQIWYQAACSYLL